MKRKPYPFPIMLETLTSRGIGRRKARRMIKHAVFTLRKANMHPWDSDGMAGFCIWCDQGKYAETWYNCGRTQYAGR